MRKVFIDYLQTIDLTQDPSSKIQIALTQLHIRHGTIYFNPEKTIGAVKSKIKIKDLSNTASQQLIGPFKSFDSRDELIFSPATLLYKINDNILTIGNFLKGKTQYCFAEQDLFDDGYISRPYTLNLFGPNVFVDIELKMPMPNTIHADEANDKKPAPIHVRRKEAISGFLAEERERLQLGNNATFQDIYAKMGSPTKRQLWDTLRNTGNTDFHDINNETDRTLQPLTPIAKELGFRFDIGRPRRLKKIISF